MIQRMYVIKSLSTKADNNLFIRAVFWFIVSQDQSIGPSFTLFKRGGRHYGKGREKRKTNFTQCAKELWPH